MIKNESRQFCFHLLDFFLLKSKAFDLRNVALRFVDPFYRHLTGRTIRD